MIEALRRLRQRLASLASRGVLLLVNDALAGQLLQVQLLAGETRDGVQHVQSYGLSAVPIAGAHPVVVLCPSGDRAQALALAIDDPRYRPTGGAPGDVVLYDSRGNRVRLLEGALEITAVADLAVSITGAATLSASGNATVTISGNASVTVSGNATITTGGSLALGGAGGQPVARVGDGVSGGVIVSGSAKVSAV